MVRPCKKYLNKTMVLRVSSITPELREQLDNVAANLNEDLSKIVRSAIREFIDRQPEKVKAKPIVIDSSDR